MADRLGKVWGLGSQTARDPGPWEGELRNMWKPTQVENLWIHGGNLHQGRVDSDYLALQLKARLVGLPLTRPQPGPQLPSILSIELRASDAGRGPGSPAGG